MASDYCRPSTAPPHRGKPTASPRPGTAAAPAYGGTARILHDALSENRKLQQQLERQSLLLRQQDEQMTRLRQSDAELVRLYRRELATKAALASTAAEEKPAYQQRAAAQSRVEELEAEVARLRGAGGGVARAPAPPARSQSPRKFSVLTWNLLADKFTKFNKEPPGCVQGHLNPDGPIETSMQTAQRYSLAVGAVLEAAADAVLLQECARGFFSPEVNPRAPELLAAYTIARQTNEKYPGTAVLLRAGGPLVPTGIGADVGVAKVPDCGGPSKVATCVLCKVHGVSCWLVSVHMEPYDKAPQKVRTHLELLGAALRAELAPGAQGAAAADAGAAPSAALPRIVLCGDLNADVETVQTLQRESAFLGGALSRVAAPAPTGLSADFSEQVSIDHIFLSPGLRLLDVTLERPPASPYGLPAVDGEPAPVIGASDHVWQCVTVALD